MNRVVNRDLVERGKSKNIAENDFLKSWNIYYDKNFQSEKLSKKLVYSNKNNIFEEIRKKLNLETYI